MWKRSSVSSSTAPPLQEKKRRRRMMHRHFRPWADLPSDLVALISCKTSSPGDHARFSAVCTSWKEAAASTPARWDAPSPVHLNVLWAQLRPLLPLVLRSSSHGGVQEDQHQDEDGQFPLLDLPPECHCIGSSRGLLLCFDSSYRLFLFDPRTAASTHVPQPDFPQVLRIRPPSHSGGSPIFYNPRIAYGTDKFLGINSFCPESLSLSSSDPADCVALCYYPELRSFVYWRSGDDRWSLLPCREPLTQATSIYYRGRFYVVDDGSFKAFACDIGPTAAVVQDIPSASSSIEAIKKAVGARELRGAFLVECRGELLLAVWSGPRRAYGREEYVPKSVFHVFRLDHTDGEEAMWVEQTQLGGSTALVLGPNESFSLSTRDFPGFEPNCLYVATCCSSRDGCDFFIYRLESGTVEIVHFDGVQSTEYFCWTHWIAPRSPLST